MKASEPSVVRETARLADLVEQLGDRYEVTGKLGLGAFGEVYRAQDTMLDRVVAIKRIRIDAFENEEQRDQVRKRSILEAQLAAALSHPNIVTIHDILPRTASTFIVMEYVDGKNLRNILKERTRLSLDETIQVLAQAASAIDYAHERKIIHRDVKPGNIMVKADGSVKMMDFGIAKSEASTSLTAVGAILGTPNYMSPEQAEGRATIDRRADLFSLGAIAFECLSGQKAFRADSAVGILLRVVKGETPRFDCETLDLHPDVGDVLTRALAKEPSERFETAATFIEALRKVPVAPPAKSAPRERPAQPVITRREPGSTSTFDLELRGSLEDKPLCNIIRDIYTTRKTGILHVKTDTVSRRLYFRKGSIVFANSDREEDRLGEFLIGRGEIDRALFELASKLMMERGQRFGRTLVELGVMTEERMEAAVLDQIDSIIRAMFSLRSGKFGFEKMDQPVEQDIVLEISTGDTIVRSIRDTVSFDIVSMELGDLSGVLRLSENPLLRYQAISLDPSEGFVLSRVDGASTIGELVSLSPLGEEETLKCVYGLISAGVLDVEEAATHRQSKRTSRKKRAREARVDARQSAKNIERLEDAEAPITDSEVEEIATLDDIAAKHAKLASASYYELLEVDPEATASGIKAAYHSMVKRYHPDRHHSAKLRQARGLLEELFVTISRAYEVLSDESARADYDGKALLQKIEPHEDPVTEKTPRAINPKFLAAEHYDAARKSYDNMAYYDAIQFLQEAVRLDPTEAAYHKLLGMALSKNPLWRDDAEESFLKAVELNPEDVDGYLRLAEIYERSGSETRARDMYRKVLDCDPANETALKNLPREGASEYNLVDRLKSSLER
jgi:serine/threonine protein kinase/Flp pilus assembly protein TadD